VHLNLQLLIGISLNSMKLLATSIFVLFFVSTFFVDQSESFGLITGTITISAASLALVGGVVLLKAVAIKALALGAAAGSAGGFGGRRGGRHGGRRGRREVGEVDKAELEEEATFTLLVSSIGQNVIDTYAKKQLS
jgi:hypothetical protein